MSLEEQALCRPVGKERRSLSFVQSYAAISDQPGQDPVETYEVIAKR